MATQLSIVIPCKNEEASIFPLFKEILLVCKKNRYIFEVIFVDDGSTDKTLKIMTTIRRKYGKKIKIIQFRGNFGKSYALQAGFNQARYKLIITMDGDQQDDPSEIPKMVSKLNEGYDLVSGWKKNRHDPLHNVIFSRILNNMLIPFLTKVKIHDTNCGFKIYRKEVVNNLNLYGELYRYIPIIAQKNNYNISEVVINHRKRKNGKSKFGWNKNIKGFLDLITIMFITGYITRPGHFFGSMGIISFTIGLLIGVYITYLRITTGGIEYRYPLLLLAVLSIIIGVQFFLTSLITELMINLKQNNNEVNNKIKKIYR